MLGFLLYLTTLSGVPHIVCIVPALYALSFRNHVFKKFPRNVYILLVLYFFFIVGATFNTAIHSFFVDKIELPYVWLLPLVFIVSYALNIKDIKWLVVLALFEALIGLYEYSIGTSTILPWAVSREVGNSELMYFNKVEGLSNGSATYSIKLLIAIILLDKFRILFSKWVYSFVSIIVICAIIMCFSRTDHQHMPRES